MTSSFPRQVPPRRGPGRVCEGHVVGQHLSEGLLIPGEYEFAGTFAGPPRQGGGSGFRDGVISFHHRGMMLTFEKSVRFFSW